MDATTKILTVFGTRPEAIKLAPVIRELDSRSSEFVCVNVISSQHTSLLQPFIRLFGIRVHHDLEVMRPHQTPSQVCSAVLGGLEPVLLREKPDLVLVQGDTATTFAAGLTAFYCGIPVGHVEAGLRTGDPKSPFPEEMNRRLVSRLATYHFAATPYNRDTLLKEGVAAERIFVTGNPVVDALHLIRERSSLSTATHELIRITEGSKLILLTTHRRESFGETMSGNLRVLRAFVDRHPDVSLVFPVHPNPNVALPAENLLGRHDRIHLTEPMDYPDFVALLSRSWLTVSDSGGVQEEAPSLGVPLLVLRENTERPEAIRAGVARLVGGHPETLGCMLEETYRDGTWADQIRRTENPFGRGDSGRRIVDAIASVFGKGRRAGARQGGSTDCAAHSS